MFHKNSETKKKPAPTSMLQGLWLVVFHFINIHQYWLRGLGELLQGMVIEIVVLGGIIEKTS